MIGRLRLGRLSLVLNVYLTWVFILLTKIDWRAIRYTLKGEHIVWSYFKQIIGRLRAYLSRLFGIWMESVTSL